MQARSIWVATRRADGWSESVTSYPGVWPPLPEVAVLSRLFRGKEGRTRSIADPASRFSSVLS